MFKSTILKKDTATAPHRSLLRATGLTGADFADNKPFIGIANSYTTVVPGHIHLDELTEEVMRGVRDAGGVPFVWGVPAVCDGIAMFVEMRLSLPSRDHIADNIEIMTLSHSFDGWVGVTNCDKITPGMLMAAGRLNLPSMILTGGPMAGGKGKDDKKLDLVSVFEAVGGYKNKKISREDLKQVECSACPSAGSCAGLFTANSMACMTECLGMSVTDCAATLATDPAKKEQAYQTGRKIVELTKQGVNARDIMTKEAFDDCMTLDNAIGGSTNVTLHLPAIAEEAGIDIDLHDFDQISKTTPNLCHLSPVGKDHMEDLHRAGGIKAVMNRLADKMTLDRQSVNGNLQKAIATAKVLDDEVIRPLDNPFYIEGGVAALVGNFCEESVIKQTGVTEDMLTHQ